MIITGGENVSPVEIESCLSLHPAVFEVAVVGPSRRALGQDRRRLREAQRRRSTKQDLEQYCRTSGLANFKRPRRFVFVDALPKSPVGKLLRRKLVAGEYRTTEHRPQARLDNPRRTDMSSPLRLRRSPACASSTAFGSRSTRRASAPTSSSTGRPTTSSSMPQRDQLRLVFEALDEDERVRIIVVARGRRAFLQRRQHQRLHGSHAGESLQACLEHRRAGALRQAGDRGQSRLLPSASASKCRSPAISASSRKPCSTRCPSRSSVRSRAPAARRACRRSSASPAPRTS